MCIRDRVFPWKARWLQFIEELQDLPDDVLIALKTKKITPTHVQLALNLPTAYEVHDGLMTAIRLGWDTGTFKTYVQNRVDQISAAHKKAETEGLPLEIPEPQPEQLIKYRQCLLCGFKKPIETVTLQFCCEPCQTLVKYLTSQLGPSEEAINTIYAALQVYQGLRAQMPQPQGPTQPGSSQQ